MSDPAACLNAALEGRYAYDRAYLLSPIWAFLYFWV